MMPTDYDPIAEQYKRSKATPWRAHVECHTLLDLIGDVTGRDVLDVACGEGFYTRLLRHGGARRAVGVDLSEGTVSLARSQEEAAPLGVEYVVGDAGDLPFEAEFDLVVAAYLLNYAPDRATLTAMCRSLARCLRPGGRFVTVNCCPKLHFPSAPSYRRYGFETTVAGEWGEGAAITWTFYLDGGEKFSIENYHLPVAAHEEAFRAAGLREVIWHEPRLSPAGEKEHGREFWEPLLAQPPVTFIECVKRGGRRRSHS